MLEEAATEHQLPTLLAPKVVSTLPTPRTRTITESTVTLDSGADADSESGITGDKREFRKAKRKQRTSPEARNKEAKKIKGAESVPPVEDTRQTPEKKETDWQEVQSKKKKKKQRAKQTLKQSEQKKPRKSVPRPNALIVRPKEKDKYADILGRVKKDVPDDQVRSTVDKIRRTATGDLLIILTKENTDRGQDLRKTISKLLGDDAEVISKGPQEEIEILDLDDTTTKQDILEALQKAVGAEAEVTLDAIRSLRKAYGGTQIASITLAASVVKQWKDQPNVSSAGTVDISPLNAKALWTGPIFAPNVENADTKPPHVKKTPDVLYVSKKAMRIAVPTLRVAADVQFLKKHS
ncbi:unnamed protein product [Euphydryas editha]|uniref:Uncharacterized protein n=1 Tax=Euphydryas editha TaxID=104508 RepID=A0AAU9V640_EUPED|nr:unnamed protein product [Euphydryas editha]